MTENSDIDFLNEIQAEINSIDDSKTITGKDLKEFCGIITGWSKFMAEKHQKAISLYGKIIDFYKREATHETQD